MANQESICCVADCNRSIHGHGYCLNHWRRVKKYGNPNGGRVSPKSKFPGQKCCVSGCDNPVDRRGYCSGHYYRLRRHGDANAGRTALMRGSKWIEKNINYNGESCLDWPFGRSDDGYGRLTFRGGKMVASRAMCLAAHGEPPDPSFHAAHSCGNGHLGCVNPKHLRWASPVENAKDKIGHETVSCGERHGASKLKECQVREIRSKYPDMSQRQLAEEYGVRRESIRSIVNYKSWKHVP